MNSFYVSLFNHINLIRELLQMHKQKLCFCVYFERTKSANQISILIMETRFPHPLQFLCYEHGRRYLPRKI
jgi:hypothetical protein